MTWLRQLAFRRRVGRLVVLVLFGRAALDPFDRDHVLVLGLAEDGDALGVAGGDADLGDPHPDQLSLVADQQQFVALLDRERRDEAAAALGQVVGDQALAAAAGPAIVVGRGALAEAL